MLNLNYIVKLFFLGTCFGWVSGSSFAQATFDASGTYSQDFGTGTISSWTNNSTFAGWYFMQNSTNTDFPPAAANFGVTSSTGLGSPGLNTGGTYTYKCGTNNLIGSRPSNSSGGTGSACANGITCGHSIGLRLQNNTGAAISSLRVSYTGLQMTSAGNGNVQNDWLIYYATGASVSSVSDAIDAIASLAYSAPNNNSSTSSGAQLGYTFCSLSSNLSHCLEVSIPINHEIMIRWSDANNSNNDPHLAIDNITVQAFYDVSCSSTLPVSLLNFNAENQGSYNQLSWTTTKEINNSGFLIERSLDGVRFDALGFVDGHGNGQGPFHYVYNDYANADQGLYYRLIQKDVDGSLTHYPTKFVPGNREPLKLSLYPNPAKETVTIKGLNPNVNLISFALINSLGYHTRVTGTWVNDDFQMDIPYLPAGHYVLQLTTAQEVIQQPLIISQ